MTGTKAHPEDLKQYRKKLERDIDLHTFSTKTQWEEFEKKHAAIKPLIEKWEAMPFFEKMVFMVSHPADSAKIQAYYDARTDIQRGSQKRSLDLLEKLSAFDSLVNEILPVWDKVNEGIKVVMNRVYVPETAKVADEAAQMSAQPSIVDYLHRYASKAIEDGLRLGATKIEVSLTANSDNLVFRLFDDEDNEKAKAVRVGFSVGGHAKKKVFIPVLSPNPHTNENQQKNNNNLLHNLFLISFVFFQVMLVGFL